MSNESRPFRTRYHLGRSSRCSRLTEEVVTKRLKAFLVDETNELKRSDCLPCRLVVEVGHDFAIAADRYAPRIGRDRDTIG